MVKLDLLSELIRKYKIHETISKLFFDESIQYLINKMFRDYTDKKLKAEWRKLLQRKS